MQGGGQFSRFAGRRAFGLLAACAAAALAAAAEASDKVYTVGNYPIGAVAESAVAAKRKALADGRQAAFRSLLKRLMPVLAYPRVKQFASVDAADLVDGVKVRSERNSSVEYIAVYDFYFRAKSVRDLLRRKGIPFTDEQAPVTTLIPIWRAGGASSAGNQTAWVKTWKGLDLENSLAPIGIEPLGTGVRPDTIAAVVAGNEMAMDTLAGQYATERVLLAVAAADATSGRLVVTLAGKDAVAPFVLTRQYRIDAADPGYARELAAVVALRTLEGRWKSVHTRGGPAGAAAPGDTDFMISVDFRGMREWQDISRKLGATPGVEELDVAGLSARGARVTLRYAQGAQRLAEQLARQGLDLQSIGGKWVLSLR